jgi:oxygen-dependent protoporphyrinogen oxidase
VAQLLTDSYGFGAGGLVRLAPGEAARFLGFQVPAAELGHGIRSFRAGMQELTDALAHRLAGRAKLQLAAPVEALERAGSGWRLRGAALGEANGAAFDQVILATSAAAAAHLLEPEFAADAAALARASTLSSLSVSLAFSREQLEHPLDGTGFVVAVEQQQQGFRACTFASSKLPERAPPGFALLRLFFRPEPDELDRVSDEEWVARAHQQLGRALRVRGLAARTWVSRWRHALPVFDAPHRERVLALEARLAEQNLWLAGAAFHGSGIDAAVRSAESAALALTRQSA